MSKGAGVIGQLLGDVILDRLGLYYASEVIDDSRFFGAGAKDLRHFPAGVSLSARIGFRESKVDLSFSGSEGISFPSGTAPAPKLASEGQLPPARPAVPVKPELEGGTRYWKDVNQTFGPLQLRRIGGEWIADNGEQRAGLGILLDAAIELLGLKVGLAGLAVKLAPSKLTTLKFQDLGFKLDGMEIDFERGPISISGVLLEGRHDVVYSGMAMIRASTFSIGAIGSYGRSRDGGILVLHLRRLHWNFGRSALLRRGGDCSRVRLQPRDCPAGDRKSPGLPAGRPGARPPRPPALRRQCRGTGH